MDVARGIFRAFIIKKRRHNIIVTLSTLTFSCFYFLAIQPARVRIEHSLNRNRRQVRFWRVDGKKSRVVKYNNKDKTKKYFIKIILKKEKKYDSIGEVKR